MSDKDLPPIPPYPEEGKATALVESVKAAAELGGNWVPGAGYVTDKLLERYVRGPLEKKRTDFHTRIATGLARLENKLAGFDPSKLQNNEEFIAAVFEATQAAMRSARETKRDALCNAVLNIAAGFTLDEVLQGSFMSYAETFSSLHLEVLRFFDEPSRLNSLLGGASQMEGATKHLISEMVVPKMASQEALDRVIDDLERADMIATTFRVVLSKHHPSNSTLKPTGKAFLKFVSDPTS